MEYRVLLFVGCLSIEQKYSLYWYVSANASKVPLYLHLSPPNLTTTLPTFMICPQTLYSFDRSRGKFSPCGVFIIAKRNTYDLNFASLSITTIVFLNLIQIGSCNFKAYSKAVPPCHFFSIPQNLLENGRV